MKIIQLVAYLLPKHTLELFRVRKIEETPQCFKVFLEEIDGISIQVEKNGFLEPIIISNENVGGKQLDVHLYVRKWKSNTDGSVFIRSWRDLHADNLVEDEYLSFLMQVESQEKALK
jgi:hypothetical protein